MASALRNRHPPNDNGNLMHNRAHPHPIKPNARECSMPVAATAQYPQTFRPRARNRRYLTNSRLRRD
eukprot:11220698-Lingulodinium_polyedra.AAC.1